MNEDFQIRLQADTALVEKTLFQLLPAPSDIPQKRLLEAVRHSLLAGGKRIRPLLALSFCRLCGGTDAAVLPAACALELYHTSTLIHDDMPEMDNDILRRGKPACHVAFGAATALLAGDVMMMMPFSWIVGTQGIDDNRKVRLVAALAEAGGCFGACGGQQIDLENETRDDVTLPELEQMYAYKTGALIRAACRMGCIAANADATVCETADAYAQKLGLAFQIVDDILDVEGSESTLGKPIGSDAEQQKNTFVSLYGLKNAKQAAARLTADALALLETLADDGFLTSLTKMLLSRQS